MLLRALYRTYWLWLKRRACWALADKILVRLRFNNGEAQGYIDRAKDELYNAYFYFDKQLKEKKK